MADFNRMVLPSKYILRITKTEVHFVRYKLCSWYVLFKSMPLVRQGYYSEDFMKYCHTIINISNLSHKVGIIVMV